MSCLKYSFIFILLFSNAFAGKFTTKECLDAKFDTSVKNDGKFFGLVKNDLLIQKTACIINIKYKNILEKEWLIDICREPIHMKISYMKNQTVNKRIKKCTTGNDTDYCSHWNELKETLQDYGLIFADGERESLTSSHGQTYCTYLLVKKYLQEGYLFSKFDQPADIFADGIVSSEELSITVPSSNVSKEVKEEVPVTTPAGVPTIEEKAEELIGESTKF